MHRMTQKGELRSIRRGVFSFEAAPLASHEEVRAAWLSLDPGKTAAKRLEDPECAVICTTSAAAVLDIGDFETPQHEFYTFTRKQLRATDTHIRVRALGPEDIQVVEGLKVTAPTRIVVDLLSETRELGHIGDLLIDTIQHGYTISWQRIQDAAYRYRSSYGLSGAEVFTSLIGAARGSEAIASLAQNLTFAFHPELKDALAKNWSNELATIL